MKHEVFWHFHLDNHLIGIIAKPVKTMSIEVNLCAISKFKSVDALNLLWKPIYLYLSKLSRNILDKFFVAIHNNLSIAILEVGI